MCERGKTMKYRRKAQQEFTLTTTQLYMADMA